MTKKRDRAVYYSDGYHGGIKGHMPFGSWPDIIQLFHKDKDWKISIEVEPVSWEYLKLHDPESYCILKNDLFSKENRDRVEIVAGSYAQPYAWNISGESNIRQLIYGIRLNKEHFPDAVLDTYAVQEPCWTSSLPQILRSLGFKRATLKDPGTAWCGYSRGINEEVVNWVGPDGSSIPCVPRYECEDLVNCWETESAQMKDEFIEKCYENGIMHPIGSQYQDLGWEAKKNLDDRVVYVTWTEYFDEIIDKPKKSWHFSQEDILCTLPWGERHLHEMTRQVRSAENKIITAEKLATMATVTANNKYPEEKFTQSWDNMMMAQHHDAWICALSRGGRENWAWLAGAQTWLVEQNCDEIISTSLLVMNEGPNSLDSNTRYVRIYNTLGVERSEVIDVHIPMSEGHNSFVLRDVNGNEVPFQYKITRETHDGIVNAVLVSFEACVPAMGHTTYAIEYKKERFDENFSDKAMKAQFIDDSTLEISTDIYNVVIDLDKGGVFKKLYHKGIDKDFCPADSEYHINEYRGYFAKLGKAMSSADNKASAKIVEDGPVKIVVVIESTISDNKLYTTITFEKGNELIDVKAHAVFNGEQWIGDPVQVDNTNDVTKRVRSHHDTFKNLHVLFPVNGDAMDLYKNAPFDVCKSRLKDTYFNSWGEIKHNIILNWIDIYDKENDTGLAIFSDHTTSYGHSEEYPVHLTFAWSGDGGFWWGKCPLKGHQVMRYAIVPHKGNWEKSLISNKSLSWNEPFVSHMSLHNETPSRSLLEVSDDHIEIAALYKEGEKLYLRLFNSSTTDRNFTLKLGFKPGKIEMIELDGRVIKELEGSSNGDTLEIPLEMQQFGLRTIVFSI